MQMTWVNCYRCAGKGYERNEIEGSYQCVQCEGVGKVEVPELPPEPPKKLIWITDPADGVLRQATYDPQGER